MDKQQYIEQLFTTMGQFRKIMESRMHTSHEERVSTVMHYSALKFLKQNKNSTVGKLALYLKLSKSSATQLVERLVKMGLVERIDDENDRRIIHVVITPEGEKKLLLLRKKFVERMTKIFSKIPEADLKELVRIHNNLIESLKEEK